MLLKNYNGGPEIPIFSFGQTVEKEPDLNPSVVEFEYNNGSSIQKKHLLVSLQTATCDIISYLRNVFTINAGRISLEYTNKINHAKMTIEPEIANNLKDYGVKPGDKIFVKHESLSSYSQARAPANSGYSRNQSEQGNQTNLGNVNPMDNDEEIKKVIEDSKKDIKIMEEEKKPQIGTLQKNIHQENKQTNSDEERAKQRTSEKFILIK